MVLKVPVVNPGGTKIDCSLTLMLAVPPTFPVTGIHGLWIGLVYYDWVCFNHLVPGSGFRSGSVSQRASGGGNIQRRKKLLLIASSSRAQELVLRRSEWATYNGWGWLKLVGRSVHRNSSGCESMAMCRLSRLCGLVVTIPAHGSRYPEFKSHWNQDPL